MANLFERRGIRSMRQIASTDQNDIFVFFISQQAVGLKACFELKSLSLREGTLPKDRDHYAYNL